MKRLLIIALFTGGAVFTANAQTDFHMPKASPTVTVNQGFSTSFIKIKYSRPSLRGRQMFGKQVPYGEVWRTGANEATKISFGEDLIFAGHKLKAGSYELYTIPNKKYWTIIFNSELNNWGARGYNPKRNVLTFKVPVKYVETKQESLLISLEDFDRPNACNLVIRWSNFVVTVPIKADNNQRILAHLQKELQGKNPPYYTAAVYYLQTNQKLNAALKYVNIAIKQKPKGYFMYWRKALILEKLGRHQEALKAAKQAAELSKSAPAFTAEYEAHYRQMLKMK